MTKTIRLFFFAGLAILAFGTAIAAQTTPQTHDEFVQAGKEAAGKKDYNAASQWYGKALAVRPDNHDIRYARAGCFVLLGKYDEAVKDLTVILEAQPDNIQVLFARASYNNAKGDYKKAHKDAEAVLKLDTNHAGGYQARGTAYAGQKKYNEAIADLTRSIGINPRDPSSYTVRAAVYEVQGNAAMAQADRLKAQQLSGK
jgi:tetratricopeptide (TPR) repeat protein